MSKHQIYSELLKLGLCINNQVILSFVDNLKIGQSRYIDRDGVEVTISCFGVNSYLVKTA